MKFSIIIPSYNQGQFIQRTINSVLSQRQDVDLEVLVFDGGSTDQTIEILNSYGDQIQTVSEKDRGQADAINKGLLRVSGDIHCYLNSDDVFYNGVLKKVANAFEKHPTVRVLYGDADHIDEKDAFVDHYYTESWNYKRFLDVCFICQSATFWRKEITLEYGFFDDSLSYAIDYEYWLRVGSREALLYLQGEKLAGSRVYSEHKSRLKRVLIHREILKVVRRYTEIPYRWLWVLADIENKKRGKKWAINVIRLSSEYSIPLDGVTLSVLMSQSFSTVFERKKCFLRTNISQSNDVIFDKIDKISSYNPRVYSAIRNFVFVCHHLIKLLENLLDSKIGKK